MSAVAAPVAEAIELVAILRDGTPVWCPGEAGAEARDVLDGTAQMYAVAGFAPPWIGYLALLGEQIVGSCAFKSPPRDGKVEIAYYCFADFERRGIATAMARRLVDIARRVAPEVCVTAQTLPEENASTRILRGLGFVLRGPRDDPEDGPVWYWEL